MAFTAFFSSASSFASYSASGTPTTVTACGFSTNRRAKSFCQKRSSASSAALSAAAMRGVRRGRSPSPPCTHVPMAPNATPSPKLVVTRAAPSSTWCITASTRSRGNPSFAIAARVASMRRSTSGTSSAATPLSPTANEVSRRVLEYPVPGAKPEPRPDSSRDSWKYACGPLSSRSDATTSAKFSRSAFCSLIWFTCRYARLTVVCLFASATTASVGTGTDTEIGAVNRVSSATSKPETSIFSNRESARVCDFSSVASSGKSPYVKKRALLGW